MTTQRILIASDHRGVPLKAALAGWMRESGYDVVDLGPVSGEERVNASDYAVKLAKEMRGDANLRGVLICGTGQAMAMTANRFKHLRAALCADSFTARMTREHNDANVLVLGAEIVGEGLAIHCLQTFLKTAFLGGRYADRCRILEDLGGL